MSQNNKKSGFTLIELMLAMSFVAILLILITITVIQISGIYNKGLLLKGANQVGRSIVDDLQRDIAASPKFDLADNYLGNKHRLCTGQYSYIWNYGSDLESPSAYRNTYDASDTGHNVIRFVKVYDPSYSYCRAAEDGALPNVNYSDESKPVAIELLDASQYDLAVHDFSITSGPRISDDKTGQQLYNIEFVIGTNDQGAIKNDAGAIKCKAPNEAGSDPTYCSVVQFNITVIAGNTAG